MKHPPSAAAVAAGRGCGGIGGGRRGLIGIAVASVLSLDPQTAIVGGPGFDLRVNQIVGSANSTSASSSYRAKAALTVMPAGSFISRMRPLGWIAAF